jgi:hypothetical protein
VKKRVRTWRWFGVERVRAISIIEGEMFGVFEGSLGE